MSALVTERLCCAYGRHRALEDLDLAVERGEIVGLLGPNGSGKTTLFRVLCTLLQPTAGTARVLEYDTVRDADAVRRSIGVVFQSPSLDRKLSARENLVHQGRLYGLGGPELRRRVETRLQEVGLSERADERTEKLSGGLRRRIELAKGLLHRPEVLLLDEPTGALDPGARIDFWQTLRRIREEAGVTVLCTTHLIEEAGRCDRICILDRGRLVAFDAPDALKSRIGGEVVTIASSDPEALCRDLEERFGGQPRVVGGRVRLEREDGPAFFPELFAAFPGRIDSVTVARPSLEDVFIHLTGHRFEVEEPPR
jgi:ABC-2 type transport system ATP-binding protein